MIELFAFSFAILSVVVEKKKKKNQKKKKKKTHTFYRSTMAGNKKWGKKVEKSWETTQIKV
jgi:hypothetical protein